MYILDQHNKKVYLTNTLEGWQFALACRCRRGHIRYTTLKAIVNENDLICQFCEHDEPAWAGANKPHVPQCEVRAMEALQSVQLDKVVACQVQLPFWHGRVDFYHIPSKTVIQIDGHSHFTGMHHKVACTQLLMDVDCCQGAWQAGVRMLRVHHEVTNPLIAMHAATHMSHPSFVMLSSKYASVRVHAAGESCSYIEWVTQQLPDATYAWLPDIQCHIFV